MLCIVNSPDFSQGTLSIFIYKVVIHSVAPILRSLRPQGISMLFLYIFSKNSCFLSSAANPLGNQAVYTQPDHQGTESSTRLQLPLHRRILRGLLQRRGDLNLYGTHGKR